ncbi:bifunctional 2-polyprenyl-6-hydroxyphenol methylase/3-demethylubiquinol 3-O-methyltransferase UbiG [uncultured Tenacibaculum sp.]|uniref:class I SAM-dependent methyltransferase n=1 Tax=uncultured Tenacibaculum sp. TaxID=174713 RepID=UPI00262AD5B1|nr:class I SAM-dependent methyltransferase [uncultured Tenacibaculum sp.]
MKKIIIKRFLTKLNLLPLIEQVNFYRQMFKNRKENKQFKLENPDVKLPPDFYMYETFQLNYKKFYTNGLPTAQWIYDHVNEFKTLEQANILDWGCGNSRILRHLPTVAGDTNKYFGCDYNTKYIKWCQDNLEGIDFKLNQLTPPLPYDHEKFDLIYGISIFTHLSLEQHHSWFKELQSVLKPNGILFLTTHGNAHKFKLTTKEQKEYEAGNLVVHDFKKEGNRLFSAYQPESFMKNITQEYGLKLLKHIPGKTENNQKPQQDIWLFQKS